jgi:DNA repair exonuclease SbcCD ATPase subunit
MKIFIFFLGLILTFQSFSIVPCWAETNKRPFWTKQSSFMEGEYLFVVGIALNAETVEEARKRAFENAKVELMNFAQITDVEAKGLVIETQTTFEETNLIDMITVYHLLRVPAKKLIEIQEHLQEQTRLQGKAFDKSQRDLQLVQQAMVSRYQRLEEQNRQIQETLDAMSRLQESLGEKALRFEQAHTEVEQLLQQLSAKVKDTQPTLTSFASPAMNNSSTKKKSIAEPLLRRLKDTENKLDAQAAQLKELSKRAKDRLAQEDELARALEKKCKYLVRGMTREEVGQIMSEPAEQYLHIPSKTSSSKYRYMNKKGATGIISVGFAYNDLVDSLDGCPGKSFH